MLVLSRKVGQKIVIGDNITIVVNKVAGNRISLGVEAPSDVRIVRGELTAPARVSPSAPLPVEEKEPIEHVVSSIGIPDLALAGSPVVHRAR